MQRVVGEDRDQPPHQRHFQPHSGGHGRPQASSHGGRQGVCRSRAAAPGLPGEAAGAGRQDPGPRDVADCTPLHYCVKYGSNAATLQMARLLLEQGADPNAKDLMGIVPLSYGVLQADVGFIKLLLEFKADPGIPNVEGLAPHMMTLVSPEISFLLMEGMKRSCLKLFLHLCPLFRLRLRHQLQLQPMLPLKNVL